MKSWTVSVVGTLVVATVLGLIFQAVFWDQPVSPELALLFVIISLLLVTAARAIWNAIVARKRTIDSPTASGKLEDSKNDEASDP